MLRYTLAMQAVIAKPFGAVGGTVWGGGGGGGGGGVFFWFQGQNLRYI